MSLCELVASRALESIISVMFDSSDGLTFRKLRRRLAADFYFYFISANSIVIQACFVRG